MAIPLTNASLTECYDDLDMSSASSKKLREQFLFYRAMNWSQTGDLKMSDIQGTAAATMPYPGSGTQRNKTYKSTYDPSLICLGDNDLNINVSSGAVSIYCQHLGSYANEIACMAKIYGQLPPNSQFIVVGDAYGNTSTCQQRIEVHGYKTGYGTGAHKLFGYIGGSANHTLGPYNSEDYPYLMISLHNNMPGQNSRKQGYTYYRNVRAKLV